MTFSEFKLLDSDEQYVTWLSKSIEVASYEEFGFLYVLFQIDNFYV